MSLTKTCVVTGSEGNPYRSGDYDNYISEPIKGNDPKEVLRLLWPTWNIRE